MLGLVIFDLDGTVVSDELTYGKVFKKILANLGVRVEEDYPHKGGVGVEENWRYFIEKYKINTNKSIEELSSETQRLYLEDLSSVRLKSGFEDFVEELKENQIATALATSNDWFVVEKLFDKLGIEKYFDVVTTAEEVKFKKPDPELFIITAEKLGIEPDNCIVFEDSVAGITAAKDAGMKVVGVARDKEMKNLLKEANLVIKDFKQITLKKLLKLYSSATE